jgi:hypothetical protein
MAARGSVDQNLATIDLSSASDTISTGLVKHLLPPVAFGVLNAIRSKTTDVNGVPLPMEMFSSMGNGFTFPLQTLIFSTLVRAVYLEAGIKPLSDNTEFRNYSCFGDDIICLSQVYDKVVRVLEACGFEVNKDKSYSSGSFRESCGKDYYEGHNVRAVYLRKVDTVQDLYSSFNRLARWSALHGVFLNSTLTYLWSCIPAKHRYIVPLDEGDTAGIRAPLSVLKDLHPNASGWKYKSFQPKPIKMKLTDENVFNPDGAYIGVIGGYVRDGYITKRSNLVRYKVESRETPSWDFLPFAGFTSRDLAWIISIAVS